MFSSITNNLIIVINAIFNFLTNTANILLNNYVFKVILFITIIGFILSIIYKIYCKITNKEEASDEELIYSDDYDDDFWEDDDLW